MTTATKKLLIIDDDEAVIDYLHAKLGSRFRIVSTNDSERALDLARASCSWSTEPLPGNIN